ncbi:hypothetical protein E3P95_00600 [Wallemia ichthyophaga]|nr:hypothetical protein E3P95_00600 [Wallemia ichthyophaga]TIB35981.1 hypothetical protein E3P85_00265 [Wallemia ichthyophaga]TIB62165.1 hypothetical protein E3P79_00266 [Wallemia ichthyophaga]
MRSTDRKHNGLHSYRVSPVAPYVHMAKAWAPSLATWGVGVGAFGSFFLSPVPKFKQDVLQKVPFIAGFYNQEIPETDLAF